MKGIKKYTKSLDVTRQLAKEKFGKAGNSVDNEETKFIKERLHLIKWILKNIKYTGQDFIHHNDLVCDKETLLANVLTTMGEGGTIDAAVGAACGVVGNTLKESIASTKSNSQTTNEHIIDPLVKIYEVDAKLVLDCKSKQEVARLQYESAQTKLKEAQKKGGKKQTDAEQEVQQTKTAYESLTQELASQCNSLIQRMDQALLPHIQSYAAYQAAQYAKLAEQWRATQEKVTQIATTPYHPQHNAAHSVQSITNTEALSQMHESPFEPTPPQPQQTQQAPPQQQYWGPPQNPNYYPEENDPFHQQVGSQPDPFAQQPPSQPQQPQNIYSR